MGYSSEVLSNNSYQSYSPGEDFFSVFGVFFPTATGVMAGKYCRPIFKSVSASIYNMAYRSKYVRGS